MGRKKSHKTEAADTAKQGPRELEWEPGGLEGNKENEENRLRKTSRKEEGGIRRALSQGRSGGKSKNVERV